MSEKTETKTAVSVDKSLIAMFLRMTPEQRLQANNNAVRAILELRNAYRIQKANQPGSERNT